MRGRLLRLCRAIIVDADWLERPRRKMAASTSVVSVAAAVAVVPGVSPSADFSDLREIKKQLLLIAGLTRERGLLHSSKW